MNCVKLNFDGSVVGVKAAAGFSVRDHKGVLIFWLGGGGGGVREEGALNLHGGTISEVEAQGLREGFL